MLHVPTTLAVDSTGKVMIGVTIVVIVVARLIVK